jgi:hypothetical protein
MALTSQRGPSGLAIHESAGPGDDYFVESGARPVRPSASLRIIRFLQFILVVAIAALSFAICWLVGLIVGVF